MRSAIARTTITLGALISALPAAAQLRADAGVVAGNAQIGPQFQCSTSGPIIRAPYFAGVTIPTEGIAACGLKGQIVEQTATKGPISVSAAGTGPMASVGTFTGAATARASYWDLGVTASGTSTGDTSPFTYSQAASFASFADDITYTSPTVANGTAGQTNFDFLIHGMMKNITNPPYSEQGSVELALYINNVLWGAFLGTTTDANAPFIRGGSTGLPGNFVSVPGSFTGSANITTNANFDMVFGTPLHVEVALYSSVSPCCYGTSITSDFFNSATLTGIDVYGTGGTRVNDFTVTGTSGLRVTPQGVIFPDPPASTVPEPSTTALVLLGFASIGVVGKRRALRAKASRGNAPNESNVTFAAT